MKLEQSLRHLDALSASLREYNLRRSAKSMGIGYYVRAMMNDPNFQASSASPWRTLPKRTRKLFQRACSRRKT
jgi:hypothetical protein